MSDHVDPISDALADFFVNFDKRSNAERGQPTAQFGHLKIPPYRLETSIPELIRQMFSEEEPLLFVVPDMEHEVGLGLQFPDDASIKVTTYGNLLKDIHSNFDLGNNEHAPTNWRVGNKSVGWSSDRLPLKIVIIFQIDPNIPADCAISLAGIVQWSLAQSSLPRYVIRLVTLSAEEDCDLLERLLDESKLQCRFTDLDLAQYGEHEPTLNCTVINAKDVDTQVSDILTRVRAHPDKSRLVLCFDMAFYRALNAKQDPEDDQFITRGMVAVGSTVDDIGPMIDGLDAQRLL